MVSASHNEEGLNLSLDDGLKMSLNQVLEHGPQRLRDIMLTEALNVTKAMAEQERLDLQIDGNAGLSHAGHGCQDSDEDWWHPAGICDEEGYTPDCRCDENPFNDTNRKDLDAWWRAGIREQERYDLCSNLTAEGFGIPASGTSSNGIAYSPGHARKNGNNPDEHGAVNDSDGEDAQSKWWSPGGITDADEGYAPSCHCD